MVKLHHLIGKESQFSMKHRIVNIILIFGSLISFWSGVMCLLLNQTHTSILTSAIMGFGLVGIYGLSRFKKQYETSIFMALLLTSAVIPFIWFEHGGINGEVPFYLTLFSPVGAILLTGPKRILITAILVLLTVALVGLQYAYPDLVTEPSSSTAKYIEVAVALVTSIITSSLLLALILKNYEKEHLRAKIYLAESETARQHLEYLSFHDALTGLYNRTFFESELLRLDPTTLNSAAVFVIDIDELKFVNDTLGHSQGDEMLIRAAGLLRSSFPNSEPIFRTGGDEFIVILEEVPFEQLEVYYQNLHDNVARDNDLVNSLLVPLQLSVGYASSKDGSKTIRGLLAEAENKMYREKLYHHANNNRSMVQAIQVMLSARDYNTGDHGDRLEGIIVAFAKAAGVPESALADLQLFAKFHDIGKIGIPDKILRKPGPLTNEEQIEMRRHCEIGYRIACATSDLSPIAAWILRHHEWWNGDGYPLKLRGADTPFECRLLAIADSYDAMTSDRPYRTAMDHDAAIAELKKFSGTQFDPELVAVFISTELQVPDTI